MKKIGVLFVALLVGIFFVKTSSNNVTVTTNQETKDGIKTVSELEKKDVSKVQQKFNEKEEKKAKEEQENNNDNSSQASGNNYKVFFKSTVFMGDSLTQPLSLYGLLDNTSVVAEKGRNIDKALGDLDRVVNLCPNTVIMLFGMNDLGYYDNIEDYITKYKELVSELRKRIPDVKLAILSPTYITEQAALTTTFLSADRIDKANELLQDMCKKEKITYIDIRDIQANNPNMFEPDGIHLVGSFYPLMLDKIINEMKVD